MDLETTGSRATMEEAIASIEPTNPSFVQVGAHDGKKWDPIYRSMKNLRWPGIVIEPVLFSFMELCETYRGRDEVIPVQAAITAKDGPIKIKTVTPEGRLVLPDWMHGSSSLTDRNVMGGNKCTVDSYNRVKRYQIELTVNGITWDTFCKMYNVERCTLLQIDAEGYDYEILRQVDLDALGILIVRWEHHFLTGEEQEFLVDKVRSCGFGMVQTSMDTTAIRSSVKK